MRGSSILLLTIAAGLLGQAYAQDWTGRKGTRNYVPDTLPAGEATDKVHTLEGCMATWDAATHISKSKWRQICRRQIRARAAHSGAAESSEP